MSITSNLQEPVEARHLNELPGLRLNQRILLVDDDTDLRQMYAQVLKAEGYEVDYAEDGEAGWQMIHGESFTADSYDLLITDNNMPRLSGVGLIKKVRAAHLNLPIILASGSAPEDTKSLRLAAVLPKPFTADELVHTVKKALHSTPFKNENSPQTNN